MNLVYLTHISMATVAMPTGIKMITGMNLRAWVSRAVAPGNKHASHGKYRPRALLM